MSITGVCLGVFLDCRHGPQVSLSKLLMISLRRGRVMAGMEMSRTSQRLARVRAFSGSNE